MNKIKVLDLFAGTQSVRKALELMDIDFEYKGVDVYSPEEKNIIIDLSSPFTLEMILDRLDGWVPDIIWASPVCNATSQALAVKGGGTTYYKLVEGRIVPRETPEDFESLTHHGFRLKKNDREGQKTQTEFAYMTLKMFKNTRKVIDHFGVPFAIENPTGAYSKQLLEGYVRNHTHYCMYGFDYKKATTIYSNKRIHLKICDHESHGVSINPTKPNQKDVKDYKDRAAVPPELIGIIFKQLLGTGGIEKGTAVQMGLF